MTLGMTPAHGSPAMSEPSPTPAPDHPDALDPNFRIELPNFEGPLDLLLHLIRKHELDILDLPIAFITDKYLEYLGLMQGLNLDVASEYLVMAATLAHIKSKMLLPRPPEDQDDEDVDLAVSALPSPLRLAARTSRASGSGRTSSWTPGGKGSTSRTTGRARRCTSARPSLSSG